MERITTLYHIVAKHFTQDTVHHVVNRHKADTVLTHLSTEASGSTLTRFRCHNIYIPARDTAQGWLLCNQHTDTLYLQHILLTETPVKLKCTCRPVYIRQCWNAADIHTESDSQGVKQQHQACTKPDQRHRHHEEAEEVWKHSFEQS